MKGRHVPRLWQFSAQQLTAAARLQRQAAAAVDAQREEVRRLERGHGPPLGPVGYDTPPPSFSSSVVAFLFVLWGEPFPHLLGQPETSDGQ